MVAVTYGSAGLGILYYYVLFYYFKKNWNTVFASAIGTILTELYD